MTKTQISPEQLTQKVLAAVRQHPGCEGVKQVAVTPVAIVDEGTTTWHIDVIDEGDAKIETACSAVRSVHDQLITRFELAERQQQKS